MTSIEVAAWATSIRSEAKDARTNSDWRTVTEEGLRSCVSLRPMFDRIDVGAIANEAIWSRMSLFWVSFDEMAFVLNKQTKYCETHQGSAPLPEENRAELDKCCADFLGINADLKNELTSGIVE